MNEIEKMFENAEIKKFEPKEEFSLDDCEEYCLDNDCKKCCWRKYPPFTAEKQLELIKWLGIRDEFNFYQNKITKDWIFYDHEKDATHYNFELGLASWVNYLWQDLTSEEKEQIREILNANI